MSSVVFADFIPEDFKIRLALRNGSIVDHVTCHRHISKLRINFDARTATPGLDVPLQDNMTALAAWTKF